MKDEKWKNKKKKEKTEKEIIEKKKKVKTKIIQRDKKNGNGIMKKKIDEKSNSKNHKLKINDEKG